MTAVALVLVVAVLVVALGLWTSRRRAVERERQRVDALRTLDAQFERVTESLDRARPPVPEPLPRAPAPLAATQAEMTRPTAMVGATSTKLPSTKRHVSCAVCGHDTARAAATSAATAHPMVFCTFGSAIVMSTIL